MAEASGKLRVLLTGAGGRIGSSFRRYADDRFDFRLAERPGKVIDEPADHEVIELQVADRIASGSLQPYRTDPLGSWKPRQ